MVDVAQVGKHRDRWARAGIGPRKLDALQRIAEDYAAATGCQREEAYQRVTDTVLAIVVERAEYDLDVGVRLTLQPDPETP